MVTTAARRAVWWKRTCRLVLVITVAGCLPAAGRLSAVASVSPEEWARLALAPCHEFAARLEAADRRLEIQLAGTARSREETDFLRRERESRERAIAGQRSSGIARLDALLLGSKVKLSDVSPTAGRRGSFRAAAGDLLSDADACRLDAVEATVLFSVFGLPFTAERVSQLGPSRQFEALEEVFSGHLDQGRTLGQAFEAVRPAAGDQTFAHVHAVLRSAVEPVDAGNGAIVLPTATEHRLRQMIEVIRLAAEPVRIQTYLHWKAMEIEGALGMPVTEAAADQLSGRAEGLLFRDVAAMRRLRVAKPSETLAILEPAIDRWFATTVLPEMRRALSRDPFAAYWFFVQSGIVERPGPVFAGSRVTVQTPILALSSLQHLTLEAALTRIRAGRVPGYFVERHAELEQAFTELILPAEEALERIDRSAASSALRARLRDFVQARADPGGFSALDVYRVIVRDASKIKGRVDWDLVDAALALLHGGKQERLDSLIAGFVAADTHDDPRLAPYLTTAGALMIELERRQARERRFQQRTSGAFVGWLLSQFMISGGVPVELWAPGGVLGSEFAELVDELTPKNRRSGNQYEGKSAERVRLVHDGREYHAALIEIIDGAANFINVSAFDWKTDVGGRDIAYRLMAKKLGIDGARYEAFLSMFSSGLPLDHPDAPPIPFYDIPTTRMKDLLVWYVMLQSDAPEIARARVAARNAGASLECTTVKGCGDLGALQEHAGQRYDARNPSPEHRLAWEAYQRIEQLFAARAPELRQLRSRSALRDYVEDPDALRRFVRRFGPRRQDRPDEVLPIHVLADAKQTFFNLNLRDRSPFFPYLGSDPVRDIYFPLLEFDVRVVLWKGPLEFPWRLGPVPFPGRKILGVIPMPFVPYPWIAAVPGFGWAGPVSSIFLQYLLASDPRVYWAMVNHTKSWSNESSALESGMGMGSKYLNLYDEHRTWHDAGVLVVGAPAGDVNDHFVQVFNQARVNNTGLPASRGVALPKLDYAHYRYDGPEGSAAHGRTWLLTTHPEQGDSNYRGVLLAAIAAARRNIYVENSFFSDPLIARMLMRKAREFRGRVSCAGMTDLACASAKRDGVQIYLILPDSSDKPIVDAVGTADFHEMLHLGIKIHRWNPSDGWSSSAMLHTKAWLVDYEPNRGGLTYVGAANATQRSHLSDNEAGFLSTSPELAREVYERLFLPDLTTDSRIEPTEGFHITWKANPTVRASRWLRRVLVDLLWFI
jgi:phosphatidylserine/phosphatidylglycerophosphate/cardiolipin synthase-like enzyme